MDKLNNVNRELPEYRTRATFPKYVCASERVKLIGTIDGRFPDFGHHSEKEMGGMWLHPIKLLDGFWMRLKDHNAENVDVWLIADEYEVMPWGNRFYYGSNLGHTQLKIMQEQFCPEETAGLIVTYEVENQGNEPVKADLEFLVRTDLRPVWFSDKAEPPIRKKGSDMFCASSAPVVIKAQGHEWYTAIGSDTACDWVKTGDQFGPEITHGEGASISLNYSLTIAPKEKQILRFYVAGSYESEYDCLEQYHSLVKQTPEHKIMRYEKILDTARLNSPDSAFNNAYDWVKINTDWLIINAKPYGRALAAGIPEYPWWFGCDNSYSVQGLLAIGEFVLARDTLLLLLEYSEKHNRDGRILHEINTFGVNAHSGNAQETAHYIVALWLYYEYTGDLSLVERALPYMEKSVHWLKAQDTGNDGFPRGYGIIEIQGLNTKLLDTAVYTAMAYDYYVKMCKILGKQGNKLKDFSDLSTLIQKNINSLMWNDEHGLYCDAFENDKAILDRNWIINTPMEMGIADEAKAHIALENMHTPQFIGPWGMYLAGTSDKHTMTISTGVMAAAQLRYGYPDRALDLIERIFATLGKASPGCISEMSPDYGCFVQAWTVYAVMVPVVRYFFGIQPMYDEGKESHVLVLDPNPPIASWGQAELSKVPVLDGQISISYKICPDSKAVIYTGETELGACVMWKLKPSQRAVINGRECNATDEIVYVDIPKGKFVVEYIL